MLPLPGRLDLVNLGAGPATSSATQAPATQSVNANDHLFGARFHGRDVMRFQSEQFPDNGFHEHLVSSPVVVLVQQRRVADSRCFSFHIAPTQLIELKPLNPITVLGEEPNM
jgi:hypothetical protein